MVIFQVFNFVCLVGGSCIAGLGYQWIPNLDGIYIVPSKEATAVYMHSVIYTFFALFALLGLAACATRQRILVMAYTYLSALLLIFVIASGSLTLSVLSNPSQAWYIPLCLNKPLKYSTMQQLCRGGQGYMKGVAIAIFLSTLILQIEAIVLGFCYLTRLTEEEKNQNQNQTRVHIPELMGQPVQVGQQKSNPPYTFSTFSHN
ncbi:hypothetical protein FISHEDRAFT_70152 [Fistulina hepatica ATCC 64428]|uniref:Tetraspannin-domain-containing protein n=1 Tax=Fistulina hepatica ATCC 64428 TaxID=1128425 RepID=A0A0D7AK49_9AGAR|nr:hypothetical protein FISHEDRAFT_70152 [Fistulina hepatica ATCC 64428]